MNRCSKCKVSISMYQTRCYRCKVDHYDDMEKFKFKYDYADTFEILEEINKRDKPNEEL